MMDCRREGGEQLYMAAGAAARPMADNRAYMSMHDLAKIFGEEAIPEAPKADRPSPKAENIAPICRGTSNIEFRGESYCMRCEVEGEDAFCSKRGESDKKRPYCRWKN